MSSQSKYRCGSHGFYTPDFAREYDGDICQRIMCLQCEEESMDEDYSKHPLNVLYFYDDEQKVILQEAHRMSGVWKFDPPVFHPHFTFAEDLTPIVAEDALTSEEIMERMEAMQSTVEDMVREAAVNPEDVLIMPSEYTPEEMVEHAKKTLASGLN